MSTRNLAEKFINDQLKIMSEHGKAPKLSRERYEEAVADAEKTFEAMRPKTIETQDRHRVAAKS